MTMKLIFFLFTLLLNYSFGSNDYQINSLDIEESVGNLGSSTTLDCNASPNSTLLWWEKDNNNITATKNIALLRTDDGIGSKLRLTLHSSKVKDIGNYTCHAVLSENREITASRSYLLNLTLEGRVLNHTDARTNDGGDATLGCELQGYPLRDVSWHIAKSRLSELIPQNIVTTPINETHVSTHLHFHKVRHYENGTYLCVATGPDGPFNATAHLYVLNKPNVTIDVVKAVGAHSLYVNWTASDGNEPISTFYLQTRKNGTDQWLHYPHSIGGGNTSFLIQNLESEIGYQVSISAKNAIGNSEAAFHNVWVATLSHDPEFIPEVTVKGTTSDSVSIGWTQPRPDVRDYIHYYQIILQNNDTKKETIHSAASMNLYMFTGLKAMTTYRIKIRACSDYTKICNAWSREVNGTTLEGIPEPPENVSIHCHFDNISQYTSVIVSWKPPRRVFGTIKHYKVVLSGVAKFKNESGIPDLDTYGPEAKTAVGLSSRFDNVRPNTNYTVRVAGMTQQRHVGQDAVRSCMMQPTVPDRDKLSRFYWNKVESDGRWLLRLHLPRLSERNGAIRCYIIYLVRLRSGQRSSDLPPPEELPISTYSSVHRPGFGGAYIADVVDGETWSSEVFIGDERIVSPNNSICLSLTARKGPEPTTPAPPTTELPLAEIYGLNPVSTASDDENDLSTVMTLPLHASNSLDESGDRDPRSADTVEPKILTVFDGLLDATSNYTGFIEVIVAGGNETLLPAYSGYLMSLTPGPVPLGDSPLSVAPN